MASALGMLRSIQLSYEGLFNSRHLTDFLQRSRAALARK